MPTAQQCTSLCQTLDLHVWWLLALLLAFTLPLNYWKLKIENSLSNVFNIIYNSAQEGGGQKKEKEKTKNNQFCSLSYIRSSSDVVFKRWCQPMTLSDFLLFPWKFLFWSSGLLWSWVNAEIWGYGCLALSVICLHALVESFCPVQNLWSTDQWSSLHVSSSFAVFEFLCPLRVHICSTILIFISSLHKKFFGRVC